MFLASSKYTNRLWYKTFFFFLFLLIVFGSVPYEGLPTCCGSILFLSFFFFFDPFFNLFLFVQSFVWKFLLLQRLDNSPGRTECIRRGGLPGLER